MSADDITTIEQDAAAALPALLARSYARYSNFTVAAAVIDEQGRAHLGVNVENAAYPQGLCAEAGAIAALVAAGHKRILECVVVGPGPEVITPCGGCRQKLREFAGDDVPVHLCGPDGLHRTVTLGQLLPMSFGPQHFA
ncbi:MAG: cytidine deaminase [Caulobacter sp. 12-67-6]|nr:MAG: cytidine deaminase [Caulobacter sp. 12-67-6]